jgi:Flp pilus assembly protein TadD
MKLWKIFATALLVAAPAWANMGTDVGEESTNADWIAGKKAVEAQDWQQAVERLRKAAAAEPNNADIQNWLGFANRKLGQMEAAFSAYGEALRLDPRHKNAHEYIGEAYLLVGNVAKAEQHLAELEKLCTPIPCEEYKQLKRAVDEYRRTKN